MKKSSFLILAICALLSCNNNSKSVQSSTDAERWDSVYVDEPAIVESTLDYKVLDREIQSMKGLDGNEIEKVHYSIEIPSEYTKAQLQDIANTLKDKETINRVFIEFFLEGMSKNSGNYGLSKFTPEENSTTVNYVAQPKAPEKEIKKPYDGCKVYGAWKIYGATLIVYEKKGKCYMVNHYGGSNFSDPDRFIKTKYRGCTAFKNAEDPNDMYVINQDGDLDGYSFGDYAETYPMTIY